MDTVRQIITGLEAVQHVGVLHRDIKPANCFTDILGIVKFGDLGQSISTGSRTTSDISES